MRPTISSRFFLFYAEKTGVRISDGLVDSETTIWVQLRGPATSMIPGLVKLTVEEARDVRAGLEKFLADYDKAKPRE